MADVLASSKFNVTVSNPFQMVSHKHSESSPPSVTVASSSRVQSPSQVSGLQPKTFSRLRSSLEQSLRTATKSKSKLPAIVDETGVLSQSETKGKGRASEDDVPKEKEKAKSRMLSKVSFRRPGKDSSAPSPVPPPVASEQKEAEGRRGSAQGQTIPSSFTQPFALPAGSSSNVAALVSPPRERVRKSSAQPTLSTKEISGPTPLAPRRDIEASTSRSFPRSYSSITLCGTLNPLTYTPETPTRKAREATRSPDPSLPSPRGIASSSSRRAAASTSHLPLGSPPNSPTTPRVISPINARSSSRTGTHRATPSASSSHLPLASSPSPNSAPSVRRPSLDLQRPPAIAPLSSRSRSVTPTSPARSRAVSPTQRNFSPSFSQNRFLNASTTSLSPSANPEYRELIRAASSFLCKEMLKPPSQLSKSSLQPKEWEEVEVRMRALARLERVWGKSGGGMSSSSQLNSVSALSSSGLSAGGEERERRLFCEALRDGYVLCKLVNKLFPGTVARVDAKEDGFVRTSNVTMFLAGCRSVGVQANELFHRDDLLEANPESLARVAKTILALSGLSEFPGLDRAKPIVGGGGGQGQSSSASSSNPYGLGSNSRAAASTPNLSAAQRSTSSGSPVSRRRWSPPQPLPTVRSDSPNEEGSNSSGSKTVANGDIVHESDAAGQSDLDEVPPIITPPPRSPLRPRAVSERVSIADSTRASMGDSVVGSFVESLASSGLRQSQASSNLTDTTVYSSLLELQRSTSSGQNKFGTVRTFTTEATSFVSSDPPSMTRTDGSSIASSFKDDMVRKRSVDTNSRPPRERRPSETAIVDLSRVVEEEESGSSSKGGKSRDHTRSEKSSQGETPPPHPLPKASAIKLGKGKWPDDFLDAFQSARASPVLDDDDSVSTAAHTPLSISPPRKLAVVGASRPNESVDSLPQFPRRPTHRARHSVDTPASFRRMRCCAGILRLRGPLPRTASGEHGTPPSDRPSFAFPSTVPDSVKPDAPALNDRPRQPRGRFQSEIDAASSRRKPRPNSYDDLGAKPRRSRFESMVNLGVASSNASASDLMSRDSYDGSAVRQTLIVREDGKAPTSFQLGNCIGRGQFGAVYRALNLNTGQMVAVKRIRLEGLKEEEIAQLMKEVDLVKSLSHPSIVKYEGMARDDDTLNIVLEYAENGSLGQTLKAFGKLNERLVANYVVKILEGLHYLHRNDVVHCDLKAANILTTKNGNVKLSDFGVSLNLRAMEREMKDVAGTPNWMAPEVIELKGASTKSDIWSLACTVIELLTGRPLMFRIVEDDMPPLPEGCSESLQNFLKSCFNKDPTKRPSAELLCEHEWLKKNWAATSADLQKSEAIRYLAKIEMPDSDRATPDHLPHVDEFVSGSPARPRMSNDGEAISPREHSFVKTTFGKPVICRVCLQSVKRSAVLCEQCSLIAHGKCAPNAPPTCDLRAQLLLYAQYAENGNPANPYTSPMEMLANVQSNPTTSPTTDDGISRRTSVDSAPAHPSAPGSQPHVTHPPTAFKVFAAFKRSRSIMSMDQDQSPAASSPPKPNVNNRQVTHKRSVLKRKQEPKERPQSISSNSTSPNSASMRSAVTALESISSGGRGTTRQSARSTAESTGASDRMSRMTSFSEVSVAETERDDSRFPGIHMPHHGRDKKRDSKNGGCTVQ
ncbi:hypothetical protein A0H81_05896 [Grifola frondosa]|uniref:non-specific serine/threonine protein kinase n=1 Tax=Grifola frondosa TaxID=5627 RepID=A0A1C7MA59_GRIFR|nr:hypothetical protein A0H81_05896 [Grifola frondosa]